MAGSAESESRPDAEYHELEELRDGQVGLPRFPSISPDGREIAFSWGGDIWRVDAEGGEAVRLTRSSLDDLYSSFSPDGSRIAFSSMRDGYMNIFDMGRDGTGLRQVTFVDRFLRNPSYATDSDGQPVITFSGFLEADVYRDERPYRVSPSGGEHERLHDAFGSEPQISPDGRYVVFTRGAAYHDWNRRHYEGPDAMDLWLYDREDSSFTRLTERDGDDGSAQWLDDTTLIFLSDRDNATVNLYRLDLSNRSSGNEPGSFGNEPGSFGNEPGTPAGELRPVTRFRDRDVQHFDIAREAGTAVVHVWDRLYTIDLNSEENRPNPVDIVAAEDGTPEETLRRIDRDVTEAALSPDEQVMAYIAYGRVYVRNVDDFSPTRAITPGTHARHQDIAWSPDGVSLYFTSDESRDSSSIYRARVTLTREEIRRDARIRPPEEEAEPAEELPTDQPPPELPEDETNDSEEVPETARPAPDDPFAPPSPADPPGPVEPGPAPAAPGPGPGAMPQQPADERALPEQEIESADEEVPSDLDPARWHDAVQFSVEPLVDTEYNDRDIRPSPDGIRLAFRRGRGDIMVHDLETGETERLVSGWDNTVEFRWSPDGHYIAYSQNDLDFSANIFVVPADGSAEPVNVTRHPRNDRQPRWSGDGRVLTFISNRSGDTYDLYRVYLDRNLERFTRREISDYYREGRQEALTRRPIPVVVPGASDSNQEGADSAAATGVPGSDRTTELDLEQAWRRVQRITATPWHEFGHEITPGGERYIYNSAASGLVAMNWDGSGRRVLAPTVNVQHMGIRGTTLVYVTGGRAGIIDLNTGRHTRPDISDRIRIDRREQSLQKFREAARMIEENFYLPDMKGLDWPELVADYEELIARSRTSSEFSDIANRLMGELSASHMGVVNPGPASALREPSGRLGIDHERITLNDGREGYRVLDVVPEGPADTGTIPLQPGDVITDIDLREFAPDDTLLRRLRGEIGNEIIVTFERRTAGRTNSYRTLLTPIGYSQLSQLKYDAFRAERRELVKELSDGRLGYVHIQAMNQASLEEFQGNLYSAAHGKEGLIIDVRNNGGGSTTDRILTSIMAEEHAYTIPSGADPDQTGFYPQDRLDAPRYTLPINMVANEKSFSNAEILAHAFTTLDRGTLVGEQTYGGVISTGTYTLIDGARVRRPFRGWFLPDGTDMEHNGASPDLHVRQTPEDEVEQVDRQLEAAVEDMLESLDE